MPVAKKYLQNPADLLKNRCRVHWFDVQFIERCQRVNEPKAIPTTIFLL